MAIVPSPIVDPGPWVVGAGALPVPGATAGVFGQAAQLGATVSTQPVEEPQLVRSGLLAPSFGGLSWFDRIHYSRNPIDLGSLVSNQVVPLRIFSSFFVPRALSAITATNADGITLSTPGPLPITFQPQQELDFAFSVSAEGSPSVDATFSFTFDVGATAVGVEGTRITAWIWPPDWSQPVIERIEWRTDVLRGYDGSEQRIGVRRAPRKAYEFAFGAVDSARRKLDSALYGWGSRVWALPIWPDGQDLVTTLPAGASVVPITPASRDYVVDGLAILIDPGGDIFEVAEILSIGAASFATKRPLSFEFGAGSRVYPARTARLEDRQGVSRFDGRTAYGVASFRLTQQIDGAAATETLYRGFPVMTYRPEWSIDPSLSMQRKLAEIDNVVGAVVTDDESGVPEIAQSWRWSAVGRSEIAALRAFLYAREGRRRACWVPTWAEDARVVATIAAAATAIDVEAMEFARLVGSAPGRRDIRIELVSGQVFYRRVTGSSSLSNSVERLLIDAPLGLQVAPGDVALVSWMMLARLDQDTVELAWWSGDHVDAAASFRGANNAV